LLPVVLAYLVILAVAASQVAVAEKDCPRPAAAGEDRLLPVVVAEGGYDG